jgi:hypothetical protein
MSEAIAIHFPMKSSVFFVVIAAILLSLLVSYPENML